MTLCPVDQFTLCIGAYGLPISERRRFLPQDLVPAFAGLGKAAAFLSGLGVARVKVPFFALSGIFSGLTGAVMIARTDSGNPTIADSVLWSSATRRSRAGQAASSERSSASSSPPSGRPVIGLDLIYEPPRGPDRGAVALTIDRSKISIVK